MLLLFLIRVAESPPVWETPVHSVRGRLPKFECVLLSFLVLMVGFAL